MNGMSLRMMALVLLAVCLLLVLDPGHAFVAVKKQQLPSAAVSLLPRRSNKRSNPLWASTGSNNSDEEEEMDVELQRKRLESLLGTAQDASKTSTNYQNDKLLTLPVSEWKTQIRGNAPLLTSIARERMEMEISLLESLAESDDAIEELWNLWYNARGPEAAKALKQTEALVGQGNPEAWAEAEKLLKELIAREGVHFVEPVNRLATLMYLQSRHEESKELCEIVLFLKPWHFGALSGMVMVHQGLQDTEGMLDFARQRMPPLPKKGQEEKEPPAELGELETRQMWVDRMLDRARAMLLGLEMGLEESFLDLDKEMKEKEEVKTAQTTTTSNSTSVDPNTKTSDSATGSNEDEEDAWQ